MGAASPPEEPANTSIRTQADGHQGGAGCLFTGPTTITLLATGQMNITSPATIPTTQWTGNAVTGNTTDNSSYNRTGNKDNNNLSDWILATPTVGTKNSSLILPFPGPATPVPHPMPWSPAARADPAPSPCAAARRRHTDAG